MTPPNIDKFNELTGAIFAELYSKFPVPTPMYSHRFVKTSFIPDKITLGKLSDEEIFFRSTLSWLEKEGLISSDMPDIYGVRNSLLTNKSLELLNKKPASLEPSLGEQLTKAVKDETKQGLRQVAASVISQAVNVVMGS